MNEMIFLPLFRERRFLVIFFQGREMFDLLIFEISNDFLTADASLLVDRFLFLLESDRKRDKIHLSVASWCLV